MVSVCEKIALLIVIPIDTPKFWIKTRIAMAKGIWGGATAFWTAMRGYTMSVDLILDLFAPGVPTSCKTTPRPTPITIWYPIHFPTLVVGENVETRLLPTANTTLPPNAQGR